MQINEHNSNSIFPLFPSEIKSLVFSKCETESLKTLTYVSKESSTFALDTIFRRFLSDCPEEKRSNEELKKMLEGKIKALKSFITSMRYELNEGSVGYEVLCHKMNEIYKKGRIGDFVYAERKGVIQREHEEALKQVIESQLKNASLKIKTSKLKHCTPLTKTQFPWEFFEKPIMNQTESIFLCIKRMGLNDSDVAPLLRLLEAKKIVSLKFTKDDISEAGLQKIKEKFNDIKNISDQMILDLSAVSG